MFGVLVGYLRQFFEIIHNVIQSVIPSKGISYGLAIIAFTIIIRLLLLPLNVKQYKSQFEMTAIQPELEKLKKKYKNDPQRANEETMKLYKEKGVHPFAGCLPTILQLPIIYALFYVFRDLKGIEHVAFLWLPSLSAKDPYYILPILSGIAQYFSISATSMINKSKDGDNSQFKQTSTMNIGMSIFTVVITLQFKAALVLYWLSSNIIQLLQSLYFKRLYSKKQEQDS